MVRRKRYIRGEFRNINDKNIRGHNSLIAQLKLPEGTIIEERKDRTIYKYPSGKVFVKRKSLSEIYGKAYDWRSDG